MAGPFCSSHRCSASAEGRAYLVSDATEAHPDFVMSEDQLWRALDT